MLKLATSCASKPPVPQRWKNSCAPVSCWPLHRQRRDWVNRLSWLGYAGTHAEKEALTYKVGTSCACQN